MYIETASIVKRPVLGSHVREVKYWTTVADELVATYGRRYLMIFLSCSSSHIAIPWQRLQLEDMIPLVLSGVLCILARRYINEGLPIFFIVLRVMYFLSVSDRLCLKRVLKSKILSLILSSLKVHVASISDRC